MAGVTQTRSGPTEPYRTLVREARADWKAADGDEAEQDYIVTKLGSLVVRAVTDEHYWGARLAARAYVRCAPTS